MSVELTGLVSINEYSGMDALLQGGFGRYEAFSLVKTKGGSIWVRTRPRYRKPLLVLPMFPKRVLHLYR